jgi:hypothetical protein
MGAEVNQLGASLPHNHRINPEIYANHLSFPFRCLDDLSLHWIF